LLWRTGELGAAGKISCDGERGQLARGSRMPFQKTNCLTFVKTSWLIAASTIFAADYRDRSVLCAGRIVARPDGGQFRS
jgi:hypothetical protein